MEEREVKKLRNELGEFLDTNTETAPTHWAHRIGISPISMQRFLDGQTQTHRRTLKKIQVFLESYDPQKYCHCSCHTDK